MENTSLQENSRSMASQEGLCERGDVELLLSGDLPHSWDL